MGVERRNSLQNVVLIQEVDMRKHVLALIASVFVLVFGVLPFAQAQGPVAPNPGSQQSPTGNQDGGGMMGRGGMMGGGMMGRGMMGGGMMGHGQPSGGMAPMMMRMI